MIKPNLFIYLFIYLFTMLRLRNNKRKKSKRNTIQYTGGVDRGTTTAGSQLVWARIKETKTLKNTSEGGTKKL